LRICLVYDLLFPHTIGGAERWYRSLAERLAAEGHHVTYLTLRHWPDDEVVEMPGVEVVPVGPKPHLYTSGGRRRIGPALRFGKGVLGHLRREGARYDVVHTASFPYFSLLAAAQARRRHRFRLVVDWFEVWSDEYWREYLGPVLGRIGASVQRRCIRIPQHALCFSQLFARRLHEEGLRDDATVLEGIYAGPPGTRPDSAEPVVVFVGRHIPEKQAGALVPAIAQARERVPGLRAEILGDGPARPEVLRLIAEHGLEGVVEAPGFVAEGELQKRLRRALCLALPSRREGYGLVVVEAAALGVPSIVARAPDNAATELVEEGVNGAVARSAAPAELADAIIRVHAGGPALRESTADWYERNADRLSLDRSLETVIAVYAGGPEASRGAGRQADG
jgi:glycosyltransferase involved in cell wall biosynthesis